MKLIEIVLKNVKFSCLQFTATIVLVMLECMGNHTLLTCKMHWYWKDHIRRGSSASVSLVLTVIILHCIFSGDVMMTNTHITL